MKNFRQMKKVVTAVVFAGMVTAAGTGAAYAASHRDGCSSTKKDIICDEYRRTEMAGRHLLYTTANGTGVYCDKTVIVFNHKIRCASCYAALGTSELACEIMHQYCPTETGVCQRQ